MELMDTSLDLFYKKAYNCGLTIPEDVIGVISYSVCKIYSDSLWLELFLQSVIMTGSCALQCFFSVTHTVARFYCGETFSATPEPLTLL